MGVNSEQYSLNVPPIGTTPSRLASHYHQHNISDSDPKRSIRPGAFSNPTNAEIERGVGKESLWYEFNDRTVRPFSVECIADECFGGSYVVREPSFDSSQGNGEETDQLSGHQHGSCNFQRHRQRIKNNSAYLLVYERVRICQDTKADRKRPSTLRSDALASGAQAKESVFKGKLDGVDDREFTTRVDKSFLSHHHPQILMQTNTGHHLPSEVFAAVWEKNLHFLQQQQLYNHSLGCQAFIWKVGSIFLEMFSKGMEANGSADGAGTKGNIMVRKAQATLAQVFPAVCRFFVVVVLRNNFENDGKEKNSNSGSILRQWVELIRKFLHRPFDDCRCAHWFLDECLGGRGSTRISEVKKSSKLHSISFTPFESCWLKTILIDCPIPKVRRAFASLIIDAAKSISDAAAIVKPRVSESYLSKTTEEVVETQHGHT